MHAIAELIYNDQGMPVRVVGVAQDITEQKQAKELLQRSEMNLNKAQKIANLGSWVWRIPTNEIEWSAQMYQILAWKKTNSLVISMT